MPLKVMLDTNIFDIVDFEKLGDLCKSFVEQNRVKFYTSYVQISEIERIHGTPEKEDKRERLLKLVDDLHIEKLYPVGKAGFNTTKHGYDMAKWGQFKFTFAASPLQELEKEPTVAHPIGENGADLLTLGCARDDCMDYLVTQNVKDFEEGWKLLREREATKLKLINVDEFKRLLQSRFEVDS